MIKKSKVLGGGRTLAWFMVIQIARHTMDSRYFIVE
jgi:hypothetical protein